MLFRTHKRRKRRALIDGIVPDFEFETHCIASSQWFRAASPLGASSALDLFGVGLDGSKMIVVGRRPEALIERSWVAVGNQLRRSLVADARIHHPDGERFLQYKLFDPDAVEG